MADQVEFERGLKINYNSIRTVLHYHAPFWQQRLDEIWALAESTFADPKSKCKCMDHILHGGAVWVEKPTVKALQNRYAKAKQVNIKYCPECGRKLQPHETR